MPRRKSKTPQKSKRQERYITKLAEDIKRFKERELAGEQISKRERTNLRNRELRIMKKMRKEVDPLMREANRVFQMLEKEHVQSLTHQRVKDDFAKTGKTEFSVEGIYNYEGIVKEITRAKSYLNAPDTNVLTAQRTQRNQELYKKYSSQLESLSNNTYVQSGLIPSEEDAKIIFKNYRRIEEFNAARIGKQGQKGVYGSENLILYMIDVHNRGLDELEYGIKALDDFDIEQTPEFKELLKERNQVTGISGLFQKGGYYGRLAGLL